MPRSTSSLFATRRPARTALRGGLVLTLAGALTLVGCSSSTDSASETTTVPISTNAWIGYAAWNIAVDQGFDTENGISLDLIDLGDTSASAALQSGTVVATNSVIGNWMQDQDATGTEIVLLLDVSTTADALLGGPDVSSVADLEGKTVALDTQSASVYVLQYALKEAGIDPSTVEMLNVTPDQAATLLVTGEVDAAVTYEPYVSTTTAAHPELKTIYTAGEKPGLIADALAVDPEYADAHPEVMDALMKTWNEVVDFIDTDPEEAHAIIAKAVGAPLEDLETGFAGIEYYDLAENKALFDAGYVDGIVTEVEQIGESTGLIDPAKAPDLSKTINITYLEQALKG